jgi:hypothetical protein
LAGAACGGFGLITESSLRCEAAGSAARGGTVGVAPALSFAMTLALSIRPVSGAASRAVQPALAAASEHPQSISTAFIPIVSCMASSIIAACLFGTLFNHIH